MAENHYLNSLLIKYQAKNLSLYNTQLSELKTTIETWANTCYIETINSGSRAKGTAINLASDVDYMISLASTCYITKDDGSKDNTIKALYDSLHAKLKEKYPNKTRAQNVSIRVTIDSPYTSIPSLEVDITPARKHSGNTNDHWLHVSKLNTWKQTNIQQHINDISQSGRTNEIQLLKIWRHRHNLDFPSIYLEYLIVDKILYYKPKGSDKREENFLLILQELAKEKDENSLYKSLDDPANANNKLSNLLTDTEKDKIRKQAENSLTKHSTDWYGKKTWNWNEIIW